MMLRLIEYSRRICKGACISPKHWGASLDIFHWWGLGVSNSAATQVGKLAIRDLHNPLAPGLLTIVCAVPLPSRSLITALVGRKPFNLFAAVRPDMILGLRRPVG